MKTLFNITLFLLVLTFIGYTKTGRVDTDKVTPTVTAQKKWVRCYQKETWCTAVGLGDSEVFIRLQVQHYFLSMEMESVRVVRYSKCEESDRFIEVSWELGEKYGLITPCSGATQPVGIPRIYLEELEPLPPQNRTAQKAD